MALDDDGRAGMAHVGPPGSGSVGRNTGKMVTSDKRKADNRSRALLHTNDLSFVLLVHCVPVRL